MVGIMEARRVRLVSMVSEEIREALRVRAAILGRDMSEIVEELLEEHLAETLEQVRAARSQPDKRKKS